MYVRTMCTQHSQSAVRHAASSILPWYGVEGPALPGMRKVYICTDYTPAQLGNRRGRRMYVLVRTDMYV